MAMKKDGGAVSLAHDFDRSDDSVDQFVLESVRSVLEIAKDEKMQVLTASELLDGKKRGSDNGCVDNHS